LQITEIKYKSRHYLITGSNGLIGREIRTQLISSISNEFGFSSNEININDYVEIPNLTFQFFLADLICEWQNLFYSKATIFLAHGYGGFSINEAEEQMQKDAYLQLIQKLNEAFDRSMMDKVMICVISSLGALSSKLSSPYQRLTLFKEYQIKQLRADFKILRLPSLWGFSWKNEKIRPKGLLAFLIYSSFSSNTATIYGSLSTLRNYLHVKSAVKAVLIAAKQRKLKIANIRSYEFHTIQGLIQQLKQSVPGRHLSIKLISSASDLNSESHIFLPSTGENVIVYNAISSEIKDEWRKLCN
jgi:nucleoside-diphosphate-sugar epimerase